MKNVRLWYKKQDTAKYASHLDLVRCFSRAVRRAGIPIWYTEGFNPKPYMTFALPLSLGQQGLCEPLDIRIVDEISPDDIAERLNAALPEGLSIVGAGESVMEPKEIAFALYSVELEFSSEDEAAHFAGEAEKIISGGELNAQKKSKKGIKTVNLCEMIEDFSVSQNADICKISMTVAAGNTLNLNAELLIDTLEAAAGDEDYVRSIVREKLLTKDMKEFC
ncbi:MAG: TIGR03936 family radical SAM-associated protein [Clostridia bacterium]|nr:TIGR03936 family radical SAM-associated protein [Clostridia bacterium]